MAGTEDSPVIELRIEDCEHKSFEESKENCPICSIVKHAYQLIREENPELITNEIFQNLVKVELNNIEWKNRQDLKETLRLEESGNNQLVSVMVPIAHKALVQSHINQLIAYEYCLANRPGIFLYEEEDDDEEEQDKETNVVTN